MAKSVFLEGLDGSGKSTQIKLLKDYLESKGIEVLVLREPGGSPYYEAIREHIHFSKLERPPISDLLTCAGGIAQNIQLTKNALDDDTWVLTDRSYVSNIVYQVAQGLDRKTAEDITLEALDGFQYDYKILIDIPVNLAFERMQEVSKKRDYWESKGKTYFEKARDEYSYYQNKFGLELIDGGQSIESIKSTIRKILGV